jgi:hypothetical protein
LTAKRDITEAPDRCDYETIRINASLRTDPEEMFLAQIAVQIRQLDVARWHPSGQTDRSATDIRREILVKRIGPLASLIRAEGPAILFLSGKAVLISAPSLPA